MNALPSLVDHQGRPIPLSGQLGSRGGEGTVFALSTDPNLAAKVYHAQKRTPERFAKLKAIISLANPRLLAVTAWPNGLIFDSRTRQPVGFTMPRISNCESIQHLYNPVQRLKYFPHSGWSFQVRAAMNLAAAFDEIHQVGCLMGDVNEKNEMVSSKALIRLIDCDSYQLRADGQNFLCEVGVCHYTPPELQGKSFRGLVRTQNHDCFGLAVLIYQLLFVGRHPYAGIYRGPGDPSFQQLIAEYRFAQGPASHTWGMSPPPHTPTFADIPPDLANLFRRAFERGSQTGTRPRPVEWFLALQRLEQSIAECPADPGHRFWRGAQTCVWCRLAERGGPEYYFGVTGGGGTFAVDEAKLRDVLRRLKELRSPDVSYDRRRFAPTYPLQPSSIPSGLKQHRQTTIVLGGAIGICLLALPFGLLQSAICIAGFLGASVFAIWLTIHIALSPWHREYRRRRVARNRARDELHDIEDDWKRTVSRYQRAHSDSVNSIRQLVDDCRRLDSKYQRELQRLTANAEALARVRHMRLHSLADAEIPKIGEGRKQVLAANNIFTAADINEDRIRGIKGFGDALTSNLLAWKDDVLRHFRFDPRTAVSPAEQKAITIKCRSEQQQILAAINQHLAELESLIPRRRAALQKLVPALQRAVAFYDQAEADLMVMTIRRHE